MRSAARLVIGIILAAAPAACRLETASGQKAEALFQEAVQIDARGDGARALPLYLQAHRWDPDLPRIRYRIARAYASLIPGDPRAAQEARRWLDESLRREAGLYGITAAEVRRDFPGLAGDPGLARLLRVRESDPGMLDRLWAAGDEVRHVVGAMGRVLGMLSRLLSFMGFRVFLILTASALLAAGLAASGIASGPPAFAASLAATGAFWYAATRALFPGTGGDFSTPLQAAAWILLPMAGVALMNRAIRCSGRRFRRWWCVRRRKPPPAEAIIAGDSALRRQAYEVGERSLALLRAYHRVLQAPSEERPDREADLIAEKRWLAEILGRSR